jgi:histidyl-tRNA synthetase
MAKEVIRPVKGTRDFYPEIMGVRTFLYEHMRAVSTSFGYQEYEGPILETFDLYIAKSSEEIVEKQSYVFEDRNGDKLTLRPELTPTLARMVASKQAQLTFPLRWWSFGPFWRYERPQKGRLREFFQWNIDQIGDASPEADAELVAIAATFLKRIGLTSDEVQILVNNRALIDEETAALGISAEQRYPVYQWIDRQDKLDQGKWEAEADAIGLDSSQISGIQKLIVNKDLWQKSPEMQRFFKAIEAFGVEEYVSFAPHIIRGFTYYTGTVFEAWDKAGEFRSIFGGGRYDNLVGDMGGQPVGAVGFAVGDTVVSLLLESLGKLPEFGRTPADIYVTAFSNDQLTSSLQLADELRRQGYQVTNELDPSKKLGKQFLYADRIGARIALVLGPDELKNNEVAVKNLETGNQEKIARVELTTLIDRMLETISGL